VIDPKRQDSFVTGKKGYSAQPDMQLRPRMASLEKGRNFRDVLRARKARDPNLLIILRGFKKHCLFCFAQRIREVILDQFCSWALIEAKRIASNDVSNAQVSIAFCVSRRRTPKRDRNPKELSANQFKLQFSSASGPQVRTLCVCQKKPQLTIFATALSCLRWHSSINQSIYRFLSAAFPEKAPCPIHATLFSHGWDSMNIFLKQHLSS